MHSDFCIAFSLTTTCSSITVQPIARPTPTCVTAWSVGTQLLTVVSVRGAFIDICADVSNIVIIIMHMNIRSYYSNTWISNEDGVFLPLHVLMLVSS